MKSDHGWLNPWKDLLVGKVVLELGCGEGLDTREISRFAKYVVACDQDPSVDPTPAVHVKQFDHREPFPFAVGEFEVVVASLCLHYFSWSTTEGIIQQVAKVLTKDGVLLCRVNAHDDMEYGAVGFSEVEPRLFDVDGQLKRFFTCKHLSKRFANGWEILSLEHKIIDRFQRQKRVWELSARNA